MKIHSPFQPSPISQVSKLAMVRPLHSRVQMGFTLLELMVVVAIIAIASVGVAISLPNQNSVNLEREAQRLAALLDSARAQSRASGLLVRWKVTDDGFKFEGLKSKGSEELQNLSHWTQAGIVLGDQKVLVLGPEPIIAKQTIVLQLEDQKIQVSTDGLHPFAVSQIAP